VVVEAVYWELELDFDDRIVSRRDRELWAAYKTALSSVSNYASPSDHIRAGIEGYMLLAGEILFEAPRLHSSWGSASGLEAAALEEVTGGPALRLIRTLAFCHMQSFVALDHVLRTNSAGGLLFEATQKSGSLPILGIPSTTLNLMATVAPHSVDLDNVRPRNRIGCPFLAVPGNLVAELHGDGFMPLVREGIFPRMPEILNVLTRARIGG
jgi:hypothetical protein